MNRYVVCVVSCCLCTFGVLHAAQAQEENRVGVRFLAGQSLDAFENDDLGVGVSGERSFFHHAVAVEFAGQMVWKDHDTEISEEMVAKIPWHIHKRADLFVGFGGVSHYHTHSGRWTGGVVGVVGDTVWVLDHWGVESEVAYTQDIVLNHHHLEAIASFVYRWED